MNEIETKPATHGGPSRRDFMRGAAIVAAAATMPSLAMAAAGGRMVAYAGGHSGNINRYNVNPDTGALTLIGQTECDTTAVWMATGPDGNVLYVCNVIPGPDAPHPEGKITAYRINPENGDLTLINSMPSGGSNPAHLSVHPSGKWVFVANYGAKGNAAGTVLAVNDDGSLGAVVDTVTIQTDPPNLGVTPAADAPPGSFAISGHNMPHTHHFEADAAGNFAYLTDLATDRIYIFSFDVANGKVTPTPQGAIVESDGAGPRTLAFHENGKWVYVSNEEASTVSLMMYDSATGGLTHKQTLQTLPEGFEGSNFVSYIQISPNGEYVWVLNRLHDSIAIFKIGSDGTLTLVNDVWTRASYPFHLGVDPTGQFIYISHLRSDNITTLKVVDGGADFEMVGYNGIRKGRFVKVVALG